MADMNNMDINECVARIVCLNQGLSDFWGNAKGWAPIEVAELLSKQRLDWQASLSRSLSRWTTEKIADDDYGGLILAWVNVGSLVEGTLKLFLSVWYKEYMVDIEAIKKSGNLASPDGLTLDPLRQFFIKKAILDDEWDSWIQYVQQKRNSIHAFKDRDLGTYNDVLDLNAYQPAND